MTKYLDYEGLKYLLPKLQQAMVASIPGSTHDVSPASHPDIRDEIDTLAEQVEKLTSGDFVPPANSFFWTVKTI